MNSCRRTQANKHICFTDTHAATQFSTPRTAARSISPEHYHIPPDVAVFLTYIQYSPQRTPLLLSNITSFLIYPSCRTADTCLLSKSSCITSLLYASPVQAWNGQTGGTDIGRANVSSRTDGRWLKLKHATPSARKKKKTRYTTTAHFCHASAFFHTSSCRLTAPDWRCARLSRVACAPAASRLEGVARN